MGKKRDMGLIGVDITRFVRLLKMLSEYRSKDQSCQKRSFIRVTSDFGKANGLFTFLSAIYHFFLHKFISFAILYIYKILR